MEDNNLTPSKAVHFEGGNYYDNLTVDIAASHDNIDSMPRQTKRAPSSNYLINRLRYLLTGALMKLKLQEFLVLNGLKRSWFDSFTDYWLNVLEGRPITVLDFSMLLHDYRKRQQFVEVLEWNSPDQHLANWQKTNQIYATLHNTRKTALHPIVGRKLWRRVKPGSAILEYGCSLAPYYYCYRQFFTHLQCKWQIADIPNFPFHYAKHLYRQDEAVSFTSILPDSFENPLKGSNGYDVIILTTVLEHLDEPVRIVGQLLEKLRPGGLFVFDYVISEGTGLDTPRALEQREECIQLILGQLTVVEGNIDITRDIGLCIAQKP